MKKYLKSDIDKFRLIVEQLETCQKLLKNPFHISARMAIILLDNLADILLYRYCLKEFKRDNELIMIYPPRFSVNKRQKSERYFNEKISVLRKLKFINNTDKTILEISHSYRNAAYHRDTHNPAIIKELARILFKSVCSLFVNFYNNETVTEFFGKKEKWLESYGLRTNFIEYLTASKSIAKKLIVGIQITLPNVRKAFVSDIYSRLKAIDNLREELPFLKEDIFLDFLLKATEFFDKNHWEDLSQEYRRLLYETLSKYRNSHNGKESTIMRHKINKAEVALDNKISTEISQFETSISSKTLHNINSSLKKFASYNSIKTLLEHYQQIDYKLSKIEYYLGQYIDEWDREIQREIDIERGK